MKITKKKKTILFIEDDLAIIEVYKIALEQAGFEVEPIISGEEAIEIIEEINRGKAGKPDLIMLDYVLPGIDGFEVLKEIRKGLETKDIKVFITTNYSIEQLKIKGEFIDGEKFILKADYPPIRMAELIKKELGPRG